MINSHAGAAAGARTTKQAQQARKGQAMNTHVLSQDERDRIHEQVAQAAAGILSAHIGQDAAQRITGQHDPTIEAVWSLADILADMIDWATRRQQAEDINAEFGFPYDDGRIGRIAEAIAQNWDEPDTVRDKIRRRQIRV